MADMDVSEYLKDRSKGARTSFEDEVKSMAKTMRSKGAQGMYDRNKGIGVSEPGMEYLNQGPDWRDGK